MEAVALDEKMPSLYLDRYEPTKGRKDFLFICTPKKWRTAIHFSEALKTSFHCFSTKDEPALCCKVFPKKTEYTIYLVAQYLDGRNEKSGLVLKFLKAGRQVDEAIRSIAEQFDDPTQLTKLDLQVELDTTKSEKFKTPKITPCIDGKRKAGAEAIADIKAQIKAFLPNLDASVATVLNEESLIKLCQDNDIDISEFEDSQPTLPKKAPKKVSEPVEEPEEIEDEVNPEEPIAEEDIDDVLEDDIQIDEPIKETKKATAKVVTKKQNPEDISEESFDLDSLL